MRPWRGGERSPFRGKGGATLTADDNEAPRFAVFAPPAERGDGPLKRQRSTSVAKGRLNQQDYEAFVEAIRSGRLEAADGV